jgi:starch synthase
MFEGMIPEDVSKLKNPDFINYSKQAIDYSDALIQGTKNINSDLLSYMKSNGKPFLEFQPKDSFIEAYDQFYQKVW